MQTTAFATGRRATQPWGSGSGARSDVHIPILWEEFWCNTVWGLMRCVILFETQFGAHYKNIDPGGLEGREPPERRQDGPGKLLGPSERSNRGSL